MLWNLSIEPGRTPYHGGDLRGILHHLLYFEELGVTTLWLTPVLKNGAAQDYHGYGAVDLYAVDPHLGNLSDYRDLVSAAHTQGLKILFDAVMNHVGPTHPGLKIHPCQTGSTAPPRSI